MVTRTSGNPLTPSSPEAFCQRKRALATSKDFDWLKYSKTYLDWLTASLTYFDWLKVSRKLKMLNSE
jgi:hypothetical protein